MARQHSRISHRFLAIALAAACIAVFALPATAQQHGRYRAQCSKIEKQLDRYVGVVATARERDDDLWEEATWVQIASLEARQREICPEQFAAARAKRAARATERMLRTAGELALRYFTFGMF